MIDTIYVEEEIRAHSRCAAVLERFAGATVVPCERYGEVFNPAAQNFRLQKARPALIIARKYDNHLLEAPAELGIGGARNYYFSHMLNCLYDCRYCFLQGMFRSAHYVLFANYEDFESAIDTRLEDDDRPTYFFSGYDCDSLALENISGFADHFLPFFERRPAAILELRTKSVSIGPLLRTAPLPNVVVAFSFTPHPTAESLEHGTPGVDSRVAALRSLAAHGWPVGVRLDPLLWYDDFRRGYTRLVREIFDGLPPDSVHSISIGPLRFPSAVFGRIETLYPDAALFAGPLAGHAGMVSYEGAIERELGDFVRAQLDEFVPQSRLFSFVPPRHE